MGKEAELIHEINSFVTQMLIILGEGTESAEKYYIRVDSLRKLLSNISNIVPDEIYSFYSEFIAEFVRFCGACSQEDFLLENVDKLAESLSTLSECLDQMTGDLTNKDRIIISYLKSIGLDKAGNDLSILIGSSSKVISGWLDISCPFVDGDAFDSLEGLLRYVDEWEKNPEKKMYDIIICSDCFSCDIPGVDAIQNFSKVLKDDGQIILRLSNDLCLQSLEKNFYVRKFDKDYFGEEAYDEFGLSNSDLLYVLTKDESVKLEKKYSVCVDKELCENGPLVSVIMSAYNHERFVAAAIESVIGQTYKNIEFIVCDDASSDSTPLIMQEYEKYFAKSIYYKDNKPGRTITLAQEYATGKYIAIMHSDDLWEKDKLAIQIDYMEKHPECATCLTWTRYTDAELNILSDDLFIQPNRSRYEWMRFFWERGNALCNPSSVSKAEFFYTERYTGIFDRQLPDFFRWVWLVQKEDIYIVPQVLTYMRRHNENKGSENTSSASKENMIRHYIELAAGWLQVIRSMDDEFFAKAFKEIMINPNAKTREEIMCEKYFLMLNHGGALISHDAICYLNEVYGEIKEVLEDKYNYTRKMIWDDELKKGIASLWG